MSRYIDADTLHDALKAKQLWVVRCGDKHNEGYTYDQVHFAIDDAPSIDIEPKRGKWIYGEHDVAMCDGYRCDKCGFFVPWDYEHKSIDFINDYHFCPNCGAEMRGKDDDSDNI